MTTERYFTLDRREHKWTEVDLSRVREGDVYVWVVDDEIMGYYTAKSKALIVNKGLEEWERQGLPDLDPTMWRFTAGGAVRFIGITVAWLIVACLTAQYGWMWPMRLWGLGFLVFLVFVLYIAIIQPRWFLKRWS